MIIKASVFLLFFLVSQGIHSGELDTIMARYLPAKAKTELLNLTRKLEKQEKEYLAERVARSSAPLPASPLPARIAETETAVGNLLRGNIARLDARGWERLREHLIRRYEAGFLPRKTIEEIEAGIPQAARRRTLAASYSAPSFLKSAEALLPASSALRETLARGRERSLRLAAFSRSAPELLLLLTPERFHSASGRSAEEKKLYSGLLGWGRDFALDEWRDLAAGDPLCRSLITDRFALFSARRPGLETAALLGMSWAEYRRGAELLALASEALRTPEEPAAASAGAEKAAPAEPPSDPNFRKNLADGRDIADRVFELFSKGGTDTDPTARMAALELLNHRFAGRLFLSADKYLPARAAFLAFLDRIYEMTDEKTAMLLQQKHGGTTVAIRDLRKEVVRREGFTLRVLCVYREETDTSGFPSPFEIDPEEARAAYARAFWTVTQGAEPDVAPESVLEWAQAHGQMLVPLPLFLSLKSGEEARSMFLDSYPDDLVRGFPDFESAFDGLSRELVFPWFKWSYKITFPLLKSEYRARGFEALLLADRIVRDTAGDLSGRPVPRGEAEKIMESLESLRLLHSSGADVEARLAGGRSLPDATEGLISVLRGGFTHPQGEFMRKSKETELILMNRAERLSAENPRFPEDAAAGLRLLNDRLADNSLAGGAYLAARKLYLDRTAVLFAERGKAAAGKDWLDALVSMGIVSERERSERSVK